MREALRALPSYFRTETKIDGIQAPDIFTLNAVLGATIEDQVVQTLNGLRPVWDSESKYQTYSFVRQPQRFPDVILRRKTAGSDDILMGIELKGWYLIAKEGEPTLRFLTSAAVCNPQDLFVVVPWALSNVLAGSPVTFAPFIETARYCAEKRNYYWQHERNTSGNRDITIASHTSPYPQKSDAIADKAVDDSGGNFGRMARYGVMDTYLAEMSDTLVRGIPVGEWRKFFRTFERKD